MSMLATDPVLDTMMRRFDRVFGDRAPFEGATNAGIPLDVTRHDDHLVLEFDLPGIDPDSIEVTVDGRELTVAAQRHLTAPEGATRVRSERPSGMFQRRVQLGDSLDLEGLTADHHHGVLEIVIPVAAAAKPRKVAIGGVSGADAN